MRSFKYVILGGGVGAGYAAHEFVRRGLAPGDLCIISSEAVVAYERPALSKGYLNPENAARLPGFHTCVGLGLGRQDPGWYAERGIQYLTGVTVTDVDVAGRKLRIGGADEVTYGKLLVATGSRPVTLQEHGTPGWDLRGIFYLRNLADAERMMQGIKECKARDGRAVVVGAGFVGMEIAAVLRQNGLEVAMVFPGGMLMDRMLPPEVATFYEDFYQNKGIEICWGQKVSELHGRDGHIEAVETTEGQMLSASMVVAGIGARPNKELFTGQLDMAAGGITVNGKLLTSDPNVYAIGDVAAFQLTRYSGNLQRQEHVTNARLTAIHAVSAIMDPENTVDYDYVPYYYSRFFSLSWQFHGINKGKGVPFGSQKDEKFGLYWVHEGRVVAAFLEGGSDVEFKWVKAVARERPKAPCEEELEDMGLEFAAKVANAG
ncbi:unnamed protein product [Ostreobium quekettii]|uniref:monodehydroascorbate reductase (NADH) n=1 Tax=Ostreobium quekettii TaxID=121088 RepID=A0A8S1JF76_9CHLO|nr:unnamed protein product [Ostreobium quekettii]|eukprot:evm.model.scf_23.10 EVM.evm.TU.scf_23.10   scf_23:87089-90193(-)